MKKILFILVFVAILAGMLSFAMAAKTENTETNTTQKAERNITYGQCVSEAAQVRIDCYAAAKAVRDACSQNATEKAAAKACLNDYKKEKAQCKTNFKNTKKTECGKIKANWLEKIRYAFA